MALKTGISALALGALLFGTTAAYADDNGWERGGADGWNNGPRHQHDADNWNGGQQWNDGHGPAFEVHVHSGGCKHGPMPRPPARQRGRYELQSVQRWVPGYHQQVWVPQHCRHKPHRHVTKCKGGYYEQQWVPGRYETVQEWVWVPAPRQGHHASTPVGYWR